MKPSARVLFFVACLTVGCRTSAKEPSQSGRLEARWTGADTGEVSAPATAEWCSDGRLLEIRAVRGDTGLAMVLYPLDTIDEDTYRVVPPEGADSLAPSAAVALRLFALNAIKGYRGDSGNVVLERSGSGELSGTVEATSRSVSAAGESLRISGKFRGLVVVPQSRGCSPETLAEPEEAEPELLDTSALGDTE